MSKSTAGRTLRADDVRVLLRPQALALGALAEVADQMGPEDEAAAQAVAGVALGGLAGALSLYDEGARLDPEAERLLLAARCLYVATAACARAAAGEGAAWPERLEPDAREAAAAGAWCIGEIERLLLERAAPEVVETRALPGASAEAQGEALAEALYRREYPER